MMQKLTEKEAKTLLYNKVAFIKDVDWNSITFVVDGVDYTFDLYWSDETLSYL